MKLAQSLPSSKVVLGLAIASTSALLLFVPIGASRRTPRMTAELPEPKTAPYVAAELVPTPSGNAIAPAEVAIPEATQITDEQLYSAGWKVAYERGLEVYADVEDTQALYELLPQFEGATTDPWEQGRMHGHIAAIHKYIGQPNQTEINHGTAQQNLDPHGWPKQISRERPILRGQSYGAE